MKAKDIAKRHGFSPVLFADWLKQAGVAGSSSSFGGFEIAGDQNVDELVDSYKAHLAAQSQSAAQAADAERQMTEAERQKAEVERQAKQQALAGMLITSGFNFDGYTITRYSGYISGDDAVQVPRKGGFWGNPTHVGDALMASLKTIRRNALTELKEAAHALGCNAVIGVDFDYLTLDPQHGSGLNNQATFYEPYVFGVTANGNAVTIEKNGDTDSL